MSIRRACVGQVILTPRMLPCAAVRSKWMLLSARLGTNARVYCGAPLQVVGPKEGGVQVILTLHKPLYTLHSVRTSNLSIPVRIAITVTTPPYPSLRLATSAGSGLAGVTTWELAAQGLAEEAPALKGSTSARPGMMITEQTESG